MGWDGIAGMEGGREGESLYPWSLSFGARLPFLLLSLLSPGHRGVARFWASSFAAGFACSGDDDAAVTALLTLLLG